MEEVVGRILQQAQYDKFYAIKKYAIRDTNLESISQ